MSSKVTTLRALALIVMAIGLSGPAPAQQAAADCPFCFRQRIFDNSTAPQAPDEPAPALNVNLSYTPATVLEGESFSLSPAVSGGTAPYAFSVVGSPPSGFSLDPSTGVLSGLLPSAGVYSFGVMATPSAGVAATAVASVVVTAPAGPGAPTSVAYAAQPQMTAPGAVYVPGPTVTGGTAPYTYEVLDLVPAGLYFNPADGSFTGSPTTAGLYVIRVRVTSQGGGSRTTSVTFDVRDAQLFAAITDVQANGFADADTPLVEKVAKISAKFWYPDNVGLPEGEQGYVLPTFSVSSYGDSTTIQFTPGNVVYFKLKVFGPGPINACVNVHAPDGGVTASYAMTESVDAAAGLEYGFGLSGAPVSRIEVFPCAQDAEFLVWLGGFEMYQ